ncbi:MAG: CoA-binding protein [Candidatus Micrarchaeota archaeon]|nr:CoA-binding protein [Candidatus Micrarchaeota archaeon]
MSDIKPFLDRSNKIALVGASANPEKWGYKLYKKLKNAGFSVFPINPKKPVIDGDESFPSLDELPEKPDVVITVVPPHVTEQVVKKCKELGIGKVWMQPGSESDEAIRFCEENGIDTIHHACFVVDGMNESF